MRGVGGRLVDPALIAAVEGDAGCAGVDQPADAMAQAPFDDVLRAAGVDFIIVPPRPGDPGHARRMKNNVHAATGIEHGTAIAEVGLDGLYAQGVQRSMAAAAEGADMIAAGGQLLDNIEAEEAPGTGDQCIHGRGCFSKSGTNGSIKKSLAGFGLGLGVARFRVPVGYFS